MKLIYLFTLMILFPQFIPGQSINHLNQSNSQLIEDKLWSICTDQKGNKWIGTSESGLIKFDGENFTFFNRNNSEVKGKIISPIFVDSNGNVWLSFSNPDGLVKFDGSSWTTYSTREIKLSKISIIAITEDNEGNLYFGGEYGLTKYDGKKWEKINLPTNKKSYSIRALAVDKFKTIAVGHNKGLLILKNGSWEIYTTDNSELQNYVRSVKFIDTGELIIGYGGKIVGGFSIFFENKWKHTNQNNSNLSNNMVRDIEIDSDGNIWMATNNGINKVTNNSISPLFFRERGNAVLDIAIEGNTIWAATLFGLFQIK